jgi:hypothetical protein
VWLQRGQEAVRGEFREFLNAYEEALGIAEATLIERLVKAGEEEPKIWMRILERRFPALELICVGLLPSLARELLSRSTSSTVRNFLPAMRVASLACPLQRIE